MFVPDDFFLEGVIYFWYVYINRIVIVTLSTEHNVQAEWE